MQLDVRGFDGHLLALNGTYVQRGSNHGKAMFSKQQNTRDDKSQQSCIYFWDARDGASMSGWWVAPEVGGEQVWAHAPGNDSMPPKSGWKAPWHADTIDPKVQMNLVPATSNPSAAPANTGMMNMLNTNNTVAPSVTSNAPSNPWAQQAAPQPPVSPVAQQPNSVAGTMQGMIQQNMMQQMMNAMAMQNMMASPSLNPQASGNNSVAGQFGMQQGGAGGSGFNNNANRQWGGGNNQQAGGNKGSSGFDQNRNQRRASPSNFGPPANMGGGGMMSGNMGGGGGKQNNKMNNQWGGDNGQNNFQKGGNGKNNMNGNNRGGGKNKNNGNKGGGRTNPYDHYGSNNQMNMMNNGGGSSTFPNNSKSSNNGNSFSYSTGGKGFDQGKNKGGGGMMGGPLPQQDAMFASAKGKNRGGKDDRGGKQKGQDRRGSRGNDDFGGGRGNNKGGKDKDNRKGGRQNSATSLFGAAGGNSMKRPQGQDGWNDVGGPQFKSQRFDQQVPSQMGAMQQFVPAGGAPLGPVSQMRLPSKDGAPPKPAVALPSPRDPQEKLTKLTEEVVKVEEMLEKLTSFIQDLDPELEAKRRKTLEFKREFQKSKTDADRAYEAAKSKVDREKNYLQKKTESGAAAPGSDDDLAFLNQYEELTTRLMTADETRNGMQAAFDVALESECDRWLTEFAGGQLTDSLETVKIAVAALADDITEKVGDKHNARSVAFATEEDATNCIESEADLLALTDPVGAQIKQLKEAIYETEQALKSQKEPDEVMKKAIQESKLAAIQEDRVWYELKSRITLKANRGRAFLEERKVEKEKDKAQLDLVNMVTETIGMATICQKEWSMLEKQMKAEEVDEADTVALLAKQASTDEALHALKKKAQKCVLRVEAIMATDGYLQSRPAKRQQRGQPPPSQENAWVQQHVQNSKNRLGGICDKASALLLEREQRKELLALEGHLHIVEKIREYTEALVVGGTPVLDAGELYDQANIGSMDYKAFQTWLIDVVHCDASRVAFGLPTMHSRATKTNAEAEPAGKIVKSQWCLCIARCIVTLTPEREPAEKNRGRNRKGNRNQNAGSTDGSKNAASDVLLELVAFDTSDADQLLAFGESVDPAAGVLTKLNAKKKSTKWSKVVTKPLMVRGSNETSIRELKPGFCVPFDPVLCVVTETVLTPGKEIRDVATGIVKPLRRLKVQEKLLALEIPVPEENSTRVLYRVPVRVLPGDSSEAKKAAAVSSTGAATGDAAAGAENAASATVEAVPSEETGWATFRDSQKNYLRPLSRTTIGDSGEVQPEGVTTTIGSEINAATAAEKDSGASGDVAENEAQPEAERPISATEIEATMESSLQDVKKHFETKIAEVKELLPKANDAFGVLTVLKERAEPVLAMLNEKTETGVADDPAMFGDMTNVPTCEEIADAVLKSETAVSDITKMMTFVRREWSTDSKEYSMIRVEQKYLELPGKGEVKNSQGNVDGAGSGKNATSGDGDEDVVMKAPEEAASAAPAVGGENSNSGQSEPPSRTGLAILQRMRLLYEIDIKGQMAEVDGPLREMMQQKVEMHGPLTQVRRYLLEQAERKGRAELAVTLGAALGDNKAQMQKHETAFEACAKELEGFPTMSLTTAYDKIKEYEVLANSLRECAREAESWAQANGSELTKFEVLKVDEETKKLQQDIHALLRRAHTALQNTNDARKRAGEAEALLSRRQRDTLMQHFAEYSQVTIDAEAEGIVEAFREAKKSKSNDAKASSTSDVEAANAEKPSDPAVESNKDDVAMKDIENKVDDKAEDEKVEDATLEQQQTDIAAAAERDGRITAQAIHNYCEENKIESVLALLQLVVRGLAGREKQSLSTREFRDFMAQSFYRCVNRTVMTEEKSLAKMKKVRQFEFNERVRVLETGLDEGGMMRARVLCAEDQMEGWITLRTSSGKPFFESYSTPVFQIKADCPITVDFESDAEAQDKKTTSGSLDAGDYILLTDFPKKDTGNRLRAPFRRLDCDGSSLEGHVTLLFNADKVAVCNGTFVHYPTQKQIQDQDSRRAVKEAAREKQRQAQLEREALALARKQKMEEEKAAKELAEQQKLEEEKAAAEQQKVATDAAAETVAAPEAVAAKPPSKEAPAGETAMEVDEVAPAAPPPESAA
ncbi:unnamed protein product [Amoebophrya sp. A120]|nr:unnamed protein product [Amoebophrya sp. A120]|eukprot:GSA120T00001982001.1